MTVVITGLERHHDRSDFDCGEPALNTFCNVWRANKPKGISTAHTLL